MAKNPGSKTPDPARRMSPVSVVLDLASSVRLGIVLLTVLFVYCAVGSAGIIYPSGGAVDFAFLGIGFRHSMIRQWPIFEMTEFEWFHTWFFNANIALICVNLTVATLRRIRFNAVNLGVWMIHSGIIILSIGSVIYFATKTEGDAPIVRRDVVIEDEGQTLRLPAIAGASGELRGVTYQVSMIDPEWELLSGEDTGKVAYSVNVGVQNELQPYVRQLLAGYPQYTEDVIPGQGRVKRIEGFGGRALVDESLSMRLELSPQDRFWLKDSSVLAVRPAGSRDSWAERPIEGLPRYNDYVDLTATETWPAPSNKYDKPHVVRPLDLAIDAGADDALAGYDVRINGYLRYAFTRSRWEPGADEINPFIEFVVGDGDTINEVAELLAFDEARSSAFSGRVAFEWIEDEAELAQMRSPRRLLVVEVAGTGESLTIEYDPPAGDDDQAEPEFLPLGDSGWSLRVRTNIDGLQMADGTRVPLLITDIRSPEGAEFTRWVFEDAERSMDRHDGSNPDDPHPVRQPDERLLTSYTFEGGLSSQLTVVAGPGIDGVASFYNNQGEIVERQLALDTPTVIIDGLAVRLLRLIPDAQAVPKPQIIPWQQRDQTLDTMRRFAMVRVEVSNGEWSQAEWIPFHRYSFTNPSLAVRTLTNWAPAVFELPDGNRVELIFTRATEKLPAPMVLDEFILTSHLGGFTGETSSIRDWTSVVTFEGDDESGRSISTNDPVEHEGYWFFQSMWDAPRAPSQGDPFGSAGMTFTVLGVGNRNGVYIQLFGCCLSVAGMMYAFYVKPIIKRRRKAAVLAAVEAGEYGEHARARAAAKQERVPEGAGASS